MEKGSGSSFSKTVFFERGEREGKRKSASRRESKKQLPRKKKKGIPSYLSCKKKERIRASMRGERKSHSPYQRERGKVGEEGLGDHIYLFFGIFF